MRNNDAIEHNYEHHNKNSAQQRNGTDTYVLPINIVRGPSDGTEENRYMGSRNRTSSTATEVDGIKDTDQEKDDAEDNQEVEFGPYTNSVGVDNDFGAFTNDNEDETVGFKVVRSNFEQLNEATGRRGWCFMYSSKCGSEAQEHIVYKVSTYRRKLGPVITLTSKVCFSALVQDFLS